MEQSHATITTLFSLLGSTITTGILPDISLSMIMIGGMFLVIFAFKLIETVLDHAGGNSPEENKASDKARTRKSVEYLGKQKNREVSQGSYQDEYADAVKADRSGQRASDPRFFSHDERKDYH